MSAAAKILAAAALTIASVVILATVWDGWLDDAACLVLFASLAVLARMALRLGAR